MGRFLQRKKAKRKRRQDYRDRLQEEKDAAWFNEKEAKLSKKHAKKLEKVYGDLSPEDINNINAVKPYVADMNDQLQEAGVSVNDSTDPIEVTTAYNTEILGENPPESYEQAYGEGFDDFDKEKAKTALKSIFGAIAGAFTARKAVANDKALKGEPLNKADQAILNVEAVKNDVIKDERKKEFGKVVKQFAPFAFLALFLYVIFKD